MRWPWVSRIDHDRMVAEINSANRYALEQMRHANERLFDTNAKLLDLYTDIAGPKKPALNPPMAIEPAEPADAITKTIREEAGRDTHLAQHLRKYARELKAQGLTEDEIVGKLVAWQTSEPEDHVASA